MARAFNQPILMRDYWLPEQIWGMSERLGIKMICAECGGGGQLYKEWLERNVRGTFNVMRQLGMLPGPVQKPPTQYSRFAHLGRSFRESNHYVSARSCVFYRLGFCSAKEKE